MTNHILTPFSRTYNLIELGNAIKVEGCHWHLLSIQGEHLFPDLGTWVSQNFFPPPPKDFFVGHWLVNQFLDKVGVNEEDRYLVITDDDMIEQGLFDKLNQFDDDVLIVSMKRSNAPTHGSGEDPYNTLIASPNNMRHGSIGFEQFVAKGRIMKQYRVPGIYHGDFLFIEQAWRDHFELFRFVPDAFVYFNYLPPGRHGRWDR